MDRLGVWTQENRRQIELLLPPAIVACLVFVAFALRVYHLDFQSFWRDEVDAVIFAKESIPSLLHKFLAVGENGPMYFTILHFWIALVGESEFSLRFFSVLFGVIAVPLTYAVGTRIVGRVAGVLAAVFALMSPYYVWYAQEAKMYALLAALSLVSLYLFVRALEDNRALSWILYVVVTSLSLYVHFFSALILVGEAAIFCFGARRYKSCARGFVLSAAALTLPYLPLAVWQLPLLANPPASPYGFMPWEAISSSLLFAFSVGFTGGGNVLAVTLFTFLLLCAAIFWRQGSLSGTEGSRWPIVILLLYLLAPLGFFYLISLRYPMFTERYLIVILPAFQLMAGAGLYVILRRSVILFVGCLTLALVFSWGSISTLQHTAVKTDFRAAVRYYEAKGEMNDAVSTVMPYMRRSFDYYHRAPYRWVEPPYTNQGTTEAEVDQEIRLSIGGVRRVWLFLAEEDFWDNRSMVRGWLDKNGRLLDEQEFSGVKLRYYELP